MAGLARLLLSTYNMTYCSHTHLRGVLNISAAPVGVLLVGEGKGAGDAGHLAPRGLDILGEAATGAVAPLALDVLAVRICLGWAPGTVKGGMFVAGFWVMSQQRHNSKKGNFDSSNTRVWGRGFRYSWQDLFYRYSWRNWLTSTADFIRGRSTAVLFNIWKLTWSSYLLKN